MGEKFFTEKIIIVLTEHPLFGYLLTPYVAEKNNDGTLYLVEQAFHASPEAIAQMSEAERAAIDIASHYTEKYLMEVYSQESIVSHFLRKLSEDIERLKSKIRPFIEKKLQEMLTLIRNNNLPLYQKQTGSKILYAHHAYKVYPHDVKIHFTFNVTKDTFHYEMRCLCDGQRVALTEEKPVIVLTAAPTTSILLGMNLYFFPHIESMRVLPFTKKESISVNVSQVEKYIDNIVIPIARHHDVSIHGLKVTNEEHKGEALLVIEDTVCDEQLLRLGFRYNDHTFAPQQADEEGKIIYRKSSDEIGFFCRNIVYESEIIRLLEASGMKQVSEVHFKLSDTAPEKNMGDWINAHRKMLQQSFVLTGNMGEAPYCLDEISIEQSCSDETDWFELHITVVVGELRIPFSRFRKHILEEKREFLLPDGRIILLPEEWFSKYNNLLELGKQTEKGFRVKHTFVGAIHSALEEQSPINFPVKSQIAAVPVPEGLKAQLRPYQHKGFSWLVQLYKQGFGGCLADDMGLGKTLQTLSLLQYIYKPISSVGNCQPENAPNFQCLHREEKADSQGQYSLFSFDSEEELLPDFHEIKKDKAVPQTNEHRSAAQNVSRKPATLIVVPTSLLHNWRKEAKRFTTLSMAEYNSATIISKKHPELFFKRFHLIFTTYGMIRNNMDVFLAYRFEYVILDESQNIKSSDSLTFRSVIQLQSNHRLVLTGTPIENSLKDLWAQFHFLQPDLLGTENSFQKQFIVPIRQGNKRMETRLQQLVAPFILRRSKNEVAPELPPLTEEIIYCEMTEEQKEYYEQEKNSLRNVLLRQTANTDRFHTFSILNGILRLRQLSCHPQLIFPHFTDASGKTEQIVETFGTLRSEGHKVLIFSSFVKHLEVLAEAFRQRGWKYALLTGMTNNRPTEITHFTEQEDVQAFLISLKAGGVGLNLTQADYVFIIDPWWNPASEAQAIARAHRIGQEKRVIAYRFITQNSIEEKILHLQDEKRKLAETFITDSEELLTLTNEQWVDLLK